MRLSPFRQLKMKLTLSFGTLFLCLIVTLGANLAASTQHQAIIDRLINHLYPARQQAQQITQLELALDSTGARYILSYDPQQQTQLLYTYQQNALALRTAVAKAMSLADTAQQRAALLDFSQYVFGNGGYDATNRQIFALKQAGQFMTASDAYAQSPMLSTMQRDIQLYTKVIDSEIVQTQIYASTIARLVQILNIGLGSSALLVGGSIAMFITRSIQRLYLRIEAQNVYLTAHNIQLQTLSTTDPLTHLPNHRALQTLLEQECERARRFGHPLSLLFFDGDRFKQVNDSYGHAVGDVVLRELGERTSSVLRAGDTVGRFGGEEFLVLLPETDIHEATIVAERLRSVVASQPFAIDAVQGGIATTVSIGVANYPNDGATPSEIREQADQAMYWAKRLGRNQVRTSAEAVRANRDAELRAATAHALERQELTVIDGCDSENRVRVVQLGLIYSLMGVLDWREPGMSAHAHEVSDLVTAMSRELAFDETRTLRAATAAFLHDIGKIALPDRLLQQAPQHFSPQEWRLLHQHAEIGAAIVDASPWLNDLAPAIRSHHAWWDGTGDPDGLVGEAIPLEARMIAIAEAYHAIISDRAYQKSRSHAEALHELKRCAGTQFDPALVAIFLIVQEKREVDQRPFRHNTAFMLPEPLGALSTPKT